MRRTINMLLFLISFSFLIMFSYGKLHGQLKAYSPDQIHDYLKSHSISQFFEEKEENSSEQKLNRNRKE